MPIDPETLVCWFDKYCDELCAELISKGVQIVPIEMYWNPNDTDKQSSVLSFYDRLPVSLDCAKVLEIVHLVEFLRDERVVIFSMNDIVCLENYDKLLISIW